MNRHDNKNTQRKTITPPATARRGINDCAHDSSFGSGISTEMGTRLQLQVQRTMNLKDNNQAYWYAMGAEAFARKSIQSL